VHAAEEIAHGRFIAIEAAENGAFHAHGLLPARRAFAHRVAQVGPHAEERLIGVADVAAEGVGTVAAKVMLRHRKVAIAAVLLVEQAERGAAVEQAHQRAFVKSELMARSAARAGPRWSWSKTPSVSAANMVFEWRKPSIRSRTGLGSGETSFRVAKWQYTLNFDREMAFRFEPATAGNWAV